MSYNQIRIPSVRASFQNLRIRVPVEDVHLLCLHVLVHVCQNESGGFVTSMSYYRCEKLLRNSCNISFLCVFKFSDGCYARVSAYEILKYIFRETLSAINSWSSPATTWTRLRSTNSRRELMISLRGKVEKMAITKRQNPLNQRRKSLGIQTRFKINHPSKIPKFEYFREYP